MPITFTTDDSQRLRTATFSGVIDDDTVINAYTGLLSGEFDPSINDLVDLSGVTQLDVSANCVTRLANLFASPDTVTAQTRTAIVAPTPVSYGMARMYQILHSDSPEEVLVCRSVAEAMAWLGS